jgi:streptogramin lyase
VPQVKAVRFHPCAAPRRLRIGLFVFLLVPYVLLFSAKALFAQTAPAAPGLSGTVKSSGGKPLEGVGVSARNAAESFTTTVYTDQAGHYFFPPLSLGEYNIWAQAIGFERVAARATLDGKARKAVDLVLPTLADFLPQLSGTEWAASLPEGTPNDRRMKSVFINNCSGCHEVSFPLQNRFDEHGWDAVITLMEKMQSIGYVPEGQAIDPVVQAYKPELAEYLSRARGPANTPLNVNPLPRPTGEAAQIVVTEYDLPRPGMPDWVMKHNGTDWSEGTPSRYDGRAAHDVAIDPGGFVWFADDATPGRTLGKLDPRTGKVVDYKLADASGHAEVSHALLFDRQGNIWFSNGTTGSPTKFDPETGQFFQYPRPDGFPFSGDFITLDSKGNVWSPDRQGAFELNPATGKYTNFSGGPPKANYDLAADDEGTVWVSQPGGNSLAHVDPSSGLVERVLLDPVVPKDFEVTDKDRDIGANLRLSANTATPLDKGPRRSVADRELGIVWVCEFFGDRLAKIDTHTRKITEYPLPYRYSQPYAATIDKYHRVWISMLNSDRIARFDPATEAFTEFELPTRGTEIRHIQVDNTTDPPTVWVPYDRTNKIARIQFRKSAGN